MFCISSLEVDYRVWKNLMHDSTQASVRAFNELQNDGAISSVTRDRNCEAFIRCDQAWQRLKHDQIRLFLLG